MKTSLSHLPEGKQQEIQRIAEIIREVANAEMIILFGSYAKGTYVEHRYHTQDGTEYEYISDYDFLVVTRDEPQEPHRIEGTIMDRVDRYKPPVNLEIHSIDYINDGLRWGQYFFSDIVSEGVVIYNTSNVSFVESKQLSPAEERKKAQDYFDLWIERCQGFISLVPVALENGYLKVGVFNLHQAAESLYFAMLLVFTGYKPRLHNLWKLRKKTKAYSEELFMIFNTDVDKNEAHLFDLLKRGYIDARYKLEYEITHEELATLIDRVRKMQSITQTICQQRIASFDSLI